MSVKQVGDATRHLHGMEAGETVGVRGPFGNSFTESRGRVLLVSGGTGTAPLLFLAKQLAAKTERLSLLRAQKPKTNSSLSVSSTASATRKTSITTTDDGTYGLQCMVTEPLANLLDKEKFDMIYTCGPEVMVKKIFELTEHVNCPWKQAWSGLCAAA